MFGKCLHEKVEMQFYAKLLKIKTLKIYFQLNKAIDLRPKCSYYFHQCHQRSVKMVWEPSKHVLIIFGSIWAAICFSILIVVLCIFVEIGKNKCIFYNLVWAPEGFLPGL